MTEGKNKNGQRYEDIIDLPHHVSSAHPQMTRRNRAAQFSPFSALSGYEEAIKETGRLTDDIRELDEDVRGFLNQKLEILREWTAKGPVEATVTYFRPDERKEGGAYVTVAGRIKKVDGIGQTVVMQDGTRIPVDGIAAIEGEAFACLEGYAF